MADPTWNMLTAAQKSAIVGLIRKTAAEAGLDTDGPVTIEGDGVKLIVPDSAL